MPPAYPQYIPRQGTASHVVREQPPAVAARASTSKHGLQDMLVPSIETASSDAVVDSPRPDRPHQVYRGRQETCSQRVFERSMQSPQQRQVIVINDDSPELKRRRVIYEDDAGHFRPLPFRDHDHYPTAPRTASYSVPASSVQPRDFLVHHGRVPSQTSQALFGDVQPTLAGPIMGEQIPIYDAPPDPGYLTSLPDRHRRVEAGYGSIPREGAPIKRPLQSPEHFLEDGSESFYTRRPLNGDMRVIENYARRRPHTEFNTRAMIQRPLSPTFPVSSRVSRSYEMGHVSEPTLLSDFSQSRPEPSYPSVRGDFATVSESSREIPIANNNNSLRFEGRPAETFTVLRAGETTRPARYVERPM